jgi:heat-inducible transcriptional repressor
MAETRSPHHSQLSARDREILRDVILTYILSAEPVSSRSVAKQGRSGLSAASIRNVMADLEDAGYLVQPHTSAGRVPTRAAYHLFIESLMQTQRISARDRRYIDENLKGTPPDAEQLMGMTSHLLSELSHQAGLVVTPQLGDTVLKAVDFVPLDGRRVLCVVISADGFIDNKVIETEEGVSREDLQRSANYLTAHFSGLTLREIRDRLLRLMAEERAQMDRLLALTIALARSGLDVDEGPEVLVDGTSELLAQPELTDIQRVRRLFETFADKARLVTMLNQCMGQGVRVLIGEDSAVTSALDFSLVATTYGVGNRTLGTLGIFGPSRMEYQKVIPLVHYLGATLSRALAESCGESREFKKN